MTAGESGLLFVAVAWAVLIYASYVSLRDDRRYRK